MAVVPNAAQALGVRGEQLDAALDAFPAMRPRLADVVPHPADGLQGHLFRGHRSVEFAEAVEESHGLSGGAKVQVERHVRVVLREAKKVDRAVVGRVVNTAVEREALLFPLLATLLADPENQPRGIDHSGTAQSGEFVPKPLRPGSVEGVFEQFGNP